MLQSRNPVLASIFSDESPFLVMKNSEIPPPVKTWTGLEEILLVKKVRRRKSDAREIYSFVEFKETNMSKQNRNKLIGFDNWLLSEGKCSLGRVR